MKKIMLCLFAATLFFGGTAMAQSKTDTATTKTKTQKVNKKSPFYGIVKFKHETINFGTAKVNHPVSVTFSFTNVSDKPVIIRGAQPSCGCTASNWTKKPILPGKKGYIKATYNAADLGQVNKTVFVNFRGIPQTLELHLKGEVKK